MLDDRPDPHDIDRAHDDDLEIRAPAPEEREVCPPAPRRSWCGDGHQFSLAETLDSLGDVLAAGRIVSAGSLPLRTSTSARPSSAPDRAHLCDVRLRDALLAVLDESSHDRVARRPCPATRSVPADEDQRRTWRPGRPRSPRSRTGRSVRWPCSPRRTPRAASPGRRPWAGCLAVSPRRDGADLQVDACLNGVRDVPRTGDPPGELAGVEGLLGDVLGLRGAHDAGLLQGSQLLSGRDGALAADAHVLRVVGPSGLPKM